MTDEQQIRDLIGRWADVVHDGDMPAVLADYAPGIGGARSRSSRWRSRPARTLRSRSRWGRCGTAEQFERDPKQRLRLAVGLGKEAGRWTLTHEHHSFAVAAESPQV